MSTSKRFFHVINDQNDVVGSGMVKDYPTKVNNTAVNVGAKLAEILGLNPEQAVRIGRTEFGVEMKPARKDRVKDGEQPFKAVAL